jgi:hypothetical protein
MWDKKNLHSNSTHRQTERVTLRVWIDGRREREKVCARQTDKERGREGEREREGFGERKMDAELHVPETMVVETKPFDLHKSAFARSSCMFSAALDSP